MNVWPIDLPQAPRKSGFAVEEQDNYIRSPMDSGPFKIRKKFSVGLLNVRCTMWLSFDQLASLKTFYNQHGAEPFEWLNFETDPPQTAVYMFAAPVQRVKLNKDTWVVSLTFVMEQEND